MSCAHGRVLSHRSLDEDAADADDEHADEVGDQEGSAAVVVGHVRKPPDISQTHRIPNH